MRFIGSVVLASCVAGALAEGVAIGPARNNTRLYLSVGDKLTITLPTKPAPGYSWRIDALDPKILAPLGKPIFVKGKTTFTYKVVGRGRFVHQVSYRRPKDKIDYANAFSLLVRVVVAESHKVVPVTLTDGGKNISLVYGETLVVRLPAERDSGWTAEIPPILRQLGKSSYDARTGAQTFRFHVALSGSSFLSFYYKRPGATLKTFRVAIFIPRAWSGISPLD